MGAFVPAVDTSRDSLALTTAYRNVIGQVLMQSEVSYIGDADRVLIVPESAED